MKKIKIELKLDDDVLNELHSDYTEYGKELAKKYVYKEAFEMHIIETVHRLINHAYGKDSKIKAEQAKATEERNKMIDANTELRMRIAQQLQAEIDHMERKEQSNIIVS